jgi:nicotinic acetylcholine receptor
VNKSYSIKPRKSKDKLHQVLVVAGDDPIETGDEALQNGLGMDKTDEILSRSYVGLHGLQGRDVEIESPEKHAMGEKSHPCLQRIEALLIGTKLSLEAMQKQNSEREQTARFRDEKAFEWRVVAITLDRVFFFIYLLSVIVLAIVSAVLLFA